MAPRPRAEAVYAADCRAGRTDLLDQLTRNARVQREGTTAA